MSERTYGGVPSAVRQAQRRHALVEAALDCLARDGLAGLSVRAVCAAGGLGPRYFYESFATLDELLLALVDEVADQIAAAAMAGFVGVEGDLLTRTRAAIDGGYGVIVDDPRKASLILEAPAGSAQLQQRRREIVVRYAQIVVANVAGLDPGRAVVAALFVVGGFAELMTAVLSGAIELSRAELVDTAADLWTAALLSAR